MNEMHRNEIQYDNRFGFARYCTAYWILSPDRVGEQFIFQFPNGMKVSVIRSTIWDFNLSVRGLLFATSMGFAIGRYEALVMDKNGNEFEQEGFLDHKGVHKLLSKWRSIVS